MSRSKISFGLTICCFLILALPGSFAQAQDEDEAEQAEPEIAPRLEELGGEPCPDYASTYTCVTLSLPLDHNNPDSDETIDVVFAIRPATGERKGMFVTVTGGPGVLGIGVAESYSDPIDPSVNEVFDFVFFDQRGMGLSGGLNCPIAVNTYYDDDTRPDIEAQEAAYIDVARTFAQDCPAEMNADNLLPFLGTDQAIQDLEVFRQTMGDDQIWLYGESYGTQFVQHYATAYPEHVAGLILDGVVDLTLEGPDFWANAARATSNTIITVLEACSAIPACASDFGTDPLEFYDDLIAELMAAPITVDFPLVSGDVEPRQLTRDDLDDLASAASFGRDDRAFFLRLLARAAQGDFLPLVRAAYVEHNLDPETLTWLPGDSTFSDGMYYAVDCLDYSHFSGTPTQRAQAYIDTGDAVEQDAPYASPVYYTDLPCVFWPVPGAEERPEQFIGGDFTTFILSATTDPITPPKDNTANLIENLNNVYVITEQGGPHVLYARYQLCPDVVINDFLVNDAVPAEQQYVCPGEPLGIYTPLTPNDAADFASPVEAVRALDTELFLLPEYYGWEGLEDKTVGCNYGGTVAFATTDAGEQFTFDNCELAAGFAVTGAGQWVYGEYFTLDLEVSGLADGQIHYERNDAANMYTVTGTYDGEAIVLEP